METVQGYPFFAIEFAKDGSVFAPAQVTDLFAGLQQLASTDLLVLSHGWNNDMPDARALYERLLAQLQPMLAGRPPAVLAALWPSKKFADTSLIASGAAGAASPITTALLATTLDQLRGVFDPPGADQRLAEAKRLLPSLEDQPSAQEAFANLLRTLVPAAEQSPDVDASRLFRTLPGQQLLASLAKPLPAALLLALPGPAGSSGHQAGVAQFFGGIKAGALNLLNYTTYYQMKERAGSVGRAGLYPILVAARRRQPALRLHLAGHSFGGRVVTAATAGPPDQPVLPVDSLTLLQAAFSHYGFSDNYDGTNAGFFRRVLTDGAVRGPVLITHSVHDSAVGTLYPLASMMAHQTSAALGDAHDLYGGMGRNGAQKTPEATDQSLHAPGTPYALAPGKIFNLCADACIQEHSDICHPEVAYAMAQAMAFA